MTQRTPSGEGYLSDTFFRIVPQKIKFLSPDKDFYSQSYLLYLEKGISTI